MCRACGQVAFFSGVKNGGAVADHLIDGVAKHAQRGIVGPDDAAVFIRYDDGFGQVAEQAGDRYFSKFNIGRFLWTVQQLG